MHLDLLTQHYKVFIDATALMHEGAPFVLGRVLKDLLRRHLARLIVPHTVVRQIQALTRAKRPQAANRAAGALRLLGDFQQNGLLTVGGTEKDPGSNSVFPPVFTTFSAAYNLCLITQDQALARRIDALQTEEDVSDQNDILVLKMVKAADNQGYGLVPWHPDRAQHQAPFTGQIRRRGVKAYGLPVEDQAGGRPFSLRTRPVAWGTTTETETQRSTAPRPQVGDQVQTARYGRLRLVRQIGAGGEGDIFLTDLGLVCKTYLPDKITTRHVDKLRLMIDHQLSHPGICWPLDFASNAEGEVVGYVMEAAQGQNLQTTVFTPRKTLEEKFPHWTRANLVRLCLSVLEKFALLHDKNVLVGDINQFNILVQSDTEAYFVDTDSYQVEAYPCPVGTVNFTAPEIQGKDFKSFLRTPRHEMFALATLLFMILVPGKPPYSQRGGTDPGANIGRLDFPYAPGGGPAGREPAGPWLYIWANLPLAVRQAFWKTFKENSRLSTERWLEIMREYLEDLGAGRANNDLFPETMPMSDPVAVQCQRCHGPYEESEAVIERLKAGQTTLLCPACRQAEFGQVVVQCVGCHYQFTAKRDVADFRRRRGQALYCPTCQVR
ncbi:MAG: hypothetical protein KKC37_05780, partial [Proteobacteria bacterium]|nr:hypothetical protein [Pseudomonadota bacterium]